MDKKCCSLDNQDHTRWILDRVEADQGVLEHPHTLATWALPLAELPAGIQPGDSLYQAHGKWHIDPQDTAHRQSRINTLFERIKAKN